MKTYKAYFEQEGGCDYTIGCGYILVDLEAKTWDAAIDEITEKMEYYGIDNIDKATLFEINEELEIDVDDIKNVQEEEKRLEKQKEIDEQEKQEFERLKQKFNK